MGVFMGGGRVERFRVIERLERRQRDGIQSRRVRRRTAHDASADPFEEGGTLRDRIGSAPSLRRKPYRAVERLSDLGLVEVEDCEPNWEPAPLQVAQR